jgi:hypothetical protein
VFGVHCSQNDGGRIHHSQRPHGGAVVSSPRAKFAAAIVRAHANLGVCLLSAELTWNDLCRRDVLPFVIVYLALGYLYMAHHVPTPEGAGLVLVEKNSTTAAAAAAAASTPAPAVESDVAFWALLALPIVVALHVLTALMQLW